MVSLNLSFSFRNDYFQAAQECTIEVYVRRTGEVMSLKVIPLTTTYGDIIKMICERRTELEPSHYYIALNYEILMENNIPFRSELQNSRFQMIMKTKWLLEHIAEQAMQKERLKPEMRKVLDEYTPHVESKLTEENSPTGVEIPTEPKRPLWGNLVESAIEKIPRQDVQEYLHKALGKAFDILLMGSPRVGKSTLINAILKKDMAQTSAGRNACTSAMAYYEYEEVYTSSIDNTSVTTSTCSIRIWDAPGIEDWTKLDVSKHIKELIKEKNPICLIYCASPGSYADVKHMQIIIEECKKLEVFVALVVTNMYASNEVDDILEEFKTLLAQHSSQTKAVGDVFHYGTIGLCTLVNSIEYESRGVKMKPTGIDELMLGIMNSLSEEKLLQWCFALMDNGPFWIRAQSRIWKTFNFIKRWIGY
jgi:small GTP-binding protein